MATNPQKELAQAQTKPSTYKKIALWINVATVVLVLAFGFYLWMKH